MDRRTFLAGAIGAAAATPALAALDAAETPMLRGTLAPAELGTDPGAKISQTVSLQRLLDAASEDDRQVFLPAGTFVVSDLVLPPRTRLAGVPGATKLVYGGGSHMIVGDHAETVEIRDIVIDGAGKALDEYVPGVLHLSEVRNVAIDNVTMVGSTKSGIAVDRCSGRITRCNVRGAGEAGIRAIESTGLTISDNTVEDCGNAGILVYRWTAGEDGTIVTGNRIARISATAGGTGQNGNGINVFRAHGVIVANNRVADCAFTAIRANSANNVQITGNNTARSGEVGIYSEFAFEGAMIANNIVDGAATGICVVNFDNGGRLAVVSGNIVRNITGKGPYDHEPPGFGIGIAIEADVAATGNVIDGAPLFGMQLGWGPYLRDVAATGNVIRRAPLGIAVSVAEGAGSAVISDNLIAGANEGAIVGMRWTETATGDLAQSGADRYPHLLVERNRVS
ncbi:MAG TPA: TIGR03808 family TAT-translocated repetitive protein [Bauldia sp.]|nr:TIGR03808 family TAT-translocated repetitive protein [Bauldia sp.]